jgi:arginine:agmatine antiporter
MRAEKQNKEHGIGLVMATLMVAGNMFGSGVFMLPANLAQIGSISIIGWIITTLGAIFLAIVFSRLATLESGADGLSSYTQRAFGNSTGYHVSMTYWVANLVGNMALVVAVLSYLSHFIPLLQNKTFFFITELFVIWMAILINMYGSTMVGRLQSISTIVALIPIAAVAIFGWFYFNPSYFNQAWNVSGQSNWSAISSSLSFTLWAFVGVESASVSAGLVRNPKRNVPIATIGGVLIVAIAYILSSSVIMGMIPNKELLASSAPFADAIRLVFGNGAAILVTACAVICALGSLLGWSMVLAQVAKSAANDGLFPRIFSRANVTGVPVQGLFILGGCMSILAILTIAPSASQQFGVLASIAVIMILIPYIYSCVALRVLSVLSVNYVSKKQYTRSIVIGILAALYCLWALISSEANATRWALIFIVAMILLYDFSIRQKSPVSKEEVQTIRAKDAWLFIIAWSIVIISASALIWIVMRS